MAGDWLKFEISTPEKPEILEITIILGYDDPDLTVGKLLKVWRWFDQHTIDGNAKNVTSALLDRLIGVTGITKAMEKVGWLIINDGGLYLPNFYRHNGKTAKDRALTANRVANHKALKDGNAKNVTSALPREEKRREENSNTNVLLVSNDVADCPHEKIIELYAKHLPMLTQVKVWSDARAKNLKTRWRENPKRQNLDFWDRFFGYVAKSDFLTGRNGQWDKCDLAWLIKSENFIKVLEGKYENKEAA